MVHLELRPYSNSEDLRRHLLIAASTSSINPSLFADSNSTPGELDRMMPPSPRQRRLVIPMLALLLLASLCAFAFATAPPAQKYPPTIVFMTDFGVLDDAVAICRGVMYSIMPEVRIVDLTHQVTPFSILDGARFLYGATPYYPAGAVFVVVVDPAAHEITNSEWMIGSKLSSTFHGRDIFSPVGAHVARGDDWTKVGPELAVNALVRLKLKSARLDDRGLAAEIIATDGPFGNLVTNIDGDDFLKLGYQRGQDVPVTVDDKPMKLKFVRTFSDVPLNQPLLYIDSRGHLGLAVNQGSFAVTYRIKPPVSLFIPRPEK